MNRRITPLFLFVLLFALPSTASAGLLVYEPFDYTPDEILTGKGGALGTTGTWHSFDTISGDGKTQDWFVHAEGTTSGVGLSGANPSVEPSGMHRWDGTVADLATSGGYAGLWGADDWNDPDGPNSGEPGRNLSADIGLLPSVTETFQSNTTTWISYVSVRGWDRNEEHPNLVLGTDPAPDGSRGDVYGGIGPDGYSGFGTGGGPTRNNRVDIYPMYYDLGQYMNVTGAISGNSYGDSAHEVSEADSMDWEELDADDYFGPPNIVVMKLEWDADTGGEDIISVVRFLEGDVLSEENFNAMITAQPNLSSANWAVAANKPNLDQSQLDTITFMGLKYFVDEVRIATTFGDALPGPGPTALTWNGDVGNWADGNWDDGSGGPLVRPSPNMLMTIDAAGSEVTVAADFISTGLDPTGPAGSVALSENNTAKLIVNEAVTLEVTEAVTVGTSGTLQVDGALTAASVICDGTLSGEGGTIEAPGIELRGVVSPGSSVGQLNVNAEFVFDEATYVCEIGRTGADLLHNQGAQDLIVSEDVMQSTLDLKAIEMADTGSRALTILSTTGEGAVGGDFLVKPSGDDPGTPEDERDYLGYGMFLESYDTTDPNAYKVNVLQSLSGDTDADGDVDPSDLSMLVQNWAPAGTDKVWREGNFDDYEDGNVDPSDLSALVQNWAPAGYLPEGGPPAGGAAAVPEPGTFVLLVLAGLCLLGHGCRCRKRTG